MVSMWWLLVAAAFGVAIGMGLSALFIAGARDPRSTSRRTPQPFREDRAGGPSTIV